MARNLPDHYDVANTTKGKVPAQVKRAFGRENICYVLITCSEPNSNGEMEVEMTHEGDKYIAMYLLDHAKDLMERQG